MQEEQELAVAVAEILISVCAHLAALEENLDEEDEELVFALTEEFYGEDGLLDFPKTEDEEEEIAHILTEAYEDPISLDEIQEIAEENPDLGVTILQSLTHILGEEEVRTELEQDFWEEMEERLASL